MLTFDEILAYIFLKNTLFTQMLYFSYYRKSKEELSLHIHDRNFIHMASIRKTHWQKDDNFHNIYSQAGKSKIIKILSFLLQLEIKWCEILLLWYRAEKKKYFIYLDQ